MKIKIAIGIAVAGILVATAFLILHRVNSQKYAPKILISKSELKNVGYSTPETAFETMMWATMIGDYDSAFASVFPKNQLAFDKRFGDSKNFKSNLQQQHVALESIQILAKKIINRNKMELKFRMILTGDFFANGRSTMIEIAPMVRVDGSWKLNFTAPNGYTTNWDKSGNIVSFAQ